ncbi:hypothetical protein [Streptomyces sp. BR123]|uniref:hypothetical protein n=1 Tax=Streptomyces sp. BR123 TaxID=2749828 RepID=UPI00211AF865|nr:hypothetical protein [Streptomyces sp. BR123]
MIRDTALHELLGRGALLPGGRHQRGVELFAQSPVPDQGTQPAQGFHGGRIAGLRQRIDRRARKLEVLGHTGCGPAAGPQGERAEVLHRGPASGQRRRPDHTAREVPVGLVDDVVVVVVVGEPGGVRTALPAAQRVTGG